MSGSLQGGALPPPAGTKKKKKAAAWILARGARLVSSREKLTGFGRRDFD